MEQSWIKNGEQKRNLNGSKDRPSDIYNTGLITISL